MTKKEQFSILSKCFNETTKAWQQNKKKIINSLIEGTYCNAQIDMWYFQPSIKGQSPNIDIKVRLWQSNMPHEELHKIYSNVEDLKGKQDGSETNYIQG